MCQFGFSAFFRLLLNLVCKAVIFPLLSKRRIDIDVLSASDFDYIANGFDGALAVVLS